MRSPSDHALGPDQLAHLRQQAAHRLTGTAVSRSPMAGAADALSVLHHLASSPDTASDALALLHELQVHQVELDLQAQELHESRTDLESALRRQTELYDCQPFACFTIDATWRLHELNQAGADMLGIPRTVAGAQSLGAFLDEAGARQLRSAISGIDAGTLRTSFVLEVCPEGGRVRPVLACVGKDPSAHRYLLSLVDIQEPAPT